MTHVPKFQTENSKIKLKIPLFYGYRISRALTIAKHLGFAEFFTGHRVAMWFTRKE